MKVIIRPRAGGKTFEAVKWVVESPNRVLLVHSEQERRRLCETYALQPDQVQTYRSFIGEYGRGIEKDVLIDNIEMFFRDIFSDRIRCEGFTLNGWIKKEFPITPDMQEYIDRIPKEQRENLDHYNATFL